DPIDRMQVSAVFHGHAHHGATEGKTKNGVPTYNVSLPLLLASGPRATPFRLVELPVAPEETHAVEHELTPVRARSRSSGSRSRWSSMSACEPASASRPRRRPSTGTSSRRSRRRGGP